MPPIETLIVRIGGDISEVLGDFDRVAQKAQRLGRQLQQFGRSMTTFVTLPLVAAGAAAVKLASDAEEAANKFEVVMGGSAVRVRERLEELTDTIPLTRSEMEGLAAGIQDLLVPMGLVRSEAADMSADMVALAGDLGSFNNVNPNEVLEAMKSALAGASEPMRRYGVDTRVARLEAIALEEGLIGQGEALNQTAMAQAVMLAIQRDSTDAMGDAARTVDSTANSFKFLWRNVRQLAITIGQQLTPVVTPLVRQANVVLGQMQELNPTLQTTILVLAGVAAAIGPVALGLGTILRLLPLLTTGFTVLLGPIGLTVLAVGALTAAGIALAKNWLGVKDQLVSAWAAIKSVVFGAIDGILGMLERLTATIPFVGAKVRDLRVDVNLFAEQSLAKSGAALATIDRQLQAVNDELVAQSAAADDAAAGVDTHREAVEKLTDAQVKLLETFRTPTPGVRAIEGAGTAGVSAAARIAAAAREAGKLRADFQQVEPPTTIGDAHVAQIIRELEAAQEHAAALKAELTDTGRQGFEAILDFATGAKDAFTDFVASALRDLAKLALRLAAFEILESLFSPQVASDITGLPAREFGGPVQAGRAFLIGERGPEVFVPSVSGSVVPGSGGASITMPITINAIDARDVAQALEQNSGTIVGILARAARSNSALRAAFAG